MRIVALVRSVVVQARRRHTATDKWVWADMPGDTMPDMAAMEPVLKAKLGDTVIILNAAQYDDERHGDVREAGPDTFGAPLPVVELVAEPAADPLTAIVDEVADAPKRRGRPPKSRVLTEEELSR